MRIVLVPGALQVACCLALVSSISAQEAPPVQAQVDATEAWMGQKVVMVVDLLSPTRFQGSPGFQIPRVPGALVMKSVESPVLSARTIEDHEYFVQRHEVLVFPQRAGEVRIPPITVRFGITGEPSAERVGTTPEFVFTSKRPPGTGKLDTVVTTTSLTVTETWDAKPEQSGDGAEATAMTGDAFVRTVVMKAADLPGMVLPALPTEAPEGLRIYPREPLVEDKSQRGDFTGTRTETLSYLCATPGQYTLPELRFPWWDPVNNQLQTEVLPAVSFTVVPNPSATAAEGADGVGAFGGQRGQLLGGLALATFLTLLATGGWRARHRIANRWLSWRTSEPVRFRQLRRTCHGTDTAAVLRAHHDWIRTLPPGPRAVWGSLTSSAGPLHRELRRLQATLFSDKRDEDWNGANLASALSEARRTLRTRPPSSDGPGSDGLAPLNPS